MREVATALRDGEPAESASLDAWSPESVTRAVAGRIAALAPGTREAARACAVLGDGAALHRSPTWPGCADDAARAAVDALRAGGILAPASRLEFLHPIVRAAVRRACRPACGRARTAKPRAWLAAGGAARERVAVHLLATDPAEDPWVCERLAAGGREALSRGAPEAAASYLERALEEPPPEAERSRLLLELGTVEAFAFRSGARRRVRARLRRSPTRPTSACRPRCCTPTSACRAGAAPTRSGR